MGPPKWKCFVVLWFRKTFPFLIHKRRQRGYSMMWGMGAVDQGIGRALTASVNAPGRVVEQPEHASRCKSKLCGNIPQSPVHETTFKVC
jgi:hypothetical protein